MATGEKSDFITNIESIGKLDIGSHMYSEVQGLMQQYGVVADPAKNLAIEQQLIADHVLTPLQLIEASAALEGKPEVTNLSLGTDVTAANTLLDQGKPVTVAVSIPEQLLAAEQYVAAAQRDYPNGKISLVVNPNLQDGSKLPNGSTVVRYAFGGSGGGGGR